MEKALRLPPGFRFHPTDEELLDQYLRRKALRCPLPASIIPDVDFSKYQPWDIPGGASAGFLEKEKYFFARGELAKRRRAGCGYWKPTGRARKIAAACGGRVAGEKRVLAFYKGRPCHGSRTDWVMHEYRLADSPDLQMEKWVLCHVFRRRGRSTRDAKTNSDSESSCLTELSVESDGEEVASRAADSTPRLLYL